MEHGAESLEPNVYGPYQAAVFSLYGGDPDHKGVAQGLAHGLPEGLRRTDFIAELFKCFASDRWLKPTSPARSNWIWRTTGTDHSDEPGEVKLERDIVERGGSATWSFQMSTMSGLFERGTHQRRAIDLVHRMSPDEFAFIELKIKSNSPVFAAFEILGYGLAYCHARQHPDVHSSASKHDVLRARRIRLVVLAPSEWYQFNLRAGPPQSFRLKELAAAFNASLENLRVHLALPDLRALTFEFRQFKDESSLLKQVGDGAQGGMPLVD